MKKQYILLIMTVYLMQLVSSEQIYRQYYAKAEEIVKVMTLEQKIGQMTNADILLLSKKGVTNHSLIQHYFLGAVMVGGDGTPDREGNLRNGDNPEDYKNATHESWNKLNKNITTAKIVIADKYEIYLLRGTDSVHGNQHIIGSVIFPHNINLASTHDTGNFEKAGYWTARDTLESGFNYIFSPCVAIAHNPQWGRYFETMGQDSKEAYKYAQAFVKGAQNIEGGKIYGVMTSTKHYLGDGATFNGNDEGNARVYEFDSFYENNIQGYRGAIASHTGTIMSSYSAINGVPMSLNGMLLMGKLKVDEEFDGFITSDYEIIQKIAKQGLPTSWLKMTDYQSVCMLINAGLDQVMLPGYIEGAIDHYHSKLKECIANGDVTVERLDDAVKRILAVKFAMNLIHVRGEKKDDKHKIEKYQNWLKLKNKDDAWKDSLKIAQESLVLLKNDGNLIPVQHKIDYIIFIGERVIEMFDVMPEFEEGEEEKQKEFQKILAQKNAAQKKLVLLEDGEDLDDEEREQKIAQLLKQKGLDPSALEDDWRYWFKQVFQDYDNIGAQCGGWTIRWQGFNGNQFWQGKYKDSSHASSILDGIKQNFKNAKPLHPQYSNSYNQEEVEQERKEFLAKLAKYRNKIRPDNTIIIGTLAESPYAEYMGDINVEWCQNTTKEQEGCLYNIHLNSYLPDQQKVTLDIDYDDFSYQILEELGDDIPLITVMISGRPMLIEKVLHRSQAFIQAWLPGTQGGEAIANSISGKYLFRQSAQSNTLPGEWQGDTESLKNFPIYEPSGEIPRFRKAIFKKGHGLKTILKNRNQDSRKDYTKEDI